MSALPPFRERNASGRCGRWLGDDYCGRPAEWHVSWADMRERPVAWQTSLCCHDHKVEADRLWDMGWRHRVLPACDVPGSLLRIDEDLTDDDGFPVTYCYHPLDGDAAAAAERDTPVLAGAAT